MLEILREELAYNHTPVRQALGHILHLTSGAANRFLVLALGFMDEGVTPPESWERAAAALPDMDRGDREAIASFGRALGGSDLEGQKAAIDGCIRMLQVRRHDAIENRDQKARLYRTLGIAAGAATVVIMI